MAIKSVGKLSALSPVNGDVPGDTSSAFELTVDAPVLGSIDFAFDQDWYRFEAKTGATYVFDLEGSATARARGVIHTCGCSTPTATRSHRTTTPAIRTARSGTRPLPTV